MEIILSPDQFERYLSLKDEILEILKKKKLPKIPTNKEKKGKYLTSKLGDNQGREVRSLILGYGNRRKGIGYFSYNKSYLELYKKIVELGKVVCPPDYTFTQIAINDSILCKKHKDKLNVGNSVIICISSCVGGLLRVWNEEETAYLDCDIRHHSWIFDGSKCFHETQPFEGQRYTIIFYNTKHTPTGTDPLLSAYAPAELMNSVPVKLS